VTHSDLLALGKIVARELHELQSQKKDYISQNEAFRMFGRTRVERWVKEERIAPKKEGNRTIYRLKQLQKLDI
jgi:hypothetical protein